MLGLSQLHGQFWAILNFIRPCVKKINVKKCFEKDELSLQTPQRVLWSWRTIQSFFSERTETEETKSLVMEFIPQCGRVQIFIFKFGGRLLLLLLSSQNILSHFFVLSASGSARHTSTMPKHCVGRHDKAEYYNSSDCKCQNMLGGYGHRKSQNRAF